MKGQKLGLFLWFLIFLSPLRVSSFSRGVILTRTRVSFALLSLQPQLIIFSDGSDFAYGFAAYIRWQFYDGDYWCRSIMAKCRIAPLNKLFTPQMELHAAVLSKRGRKAIEKEMRFNFGRALHIVDSETVLNMINKTSTPFKVYEGVMIRIGEIQAATNGGVSCWA